MWDMTMEVLAWDMWDMKTTMEIWGVIGVGLGYVGYDTYITADAASAKGDDAICKRENAKGEAPTRREWPGRTRRFDSETCTCDPELRCTMGSRSVVID